VGASTGWQTAVANEVEERNANEQDRKTSVLIGEKHCQPERDNRPETLIRSLQRNIKSHDGRKTEEPRNKIIYESCLGNFREIILIPASGFS
jgi:hypothetical protein